MRLASLQAFSQVAAFPMEVVHDCSQAMCIQADAEMHCLLSQPVLCCQNRRLAAVTNTKLFRMDSGLCWCDVLFIAVETGQYSLL